VDLPTRLSQLVAFDTQNPQGDERPLARYLAVELTRLGATTVDILETGRHASVFARLGANAPRLLLNAHIDTVPANTGYTAPPHDLIARGSRLYGLGSADTKGAIASILHALEATPASHRRPDVAVLFSGDEELGGTSMRHFLAETADARGIERAIVCEPTSCRIGWRHRGIAAVDARAVSEGGHSSRADRLPAPIAILARAAVALDEMGRRYRHTGPADFEGLCLNVAAIDGGLAFNIIPTEATLVFSMRPAPGADLKALLAEAEQIVRRAVDPEVVTWNVTLANPPFQTIDVGAFSALFGPHRQDAVDLGFWTEAALLAEAGIDAVVFGPGNIEQAHAPDEYVESAELEAASDVFKGMLSRSHR
jgi:acetylornithine deacetylase